MNVAVVVQLAFLCQYLQPLRPSDRTKALLLTRGSRSSRRETSGRLSSSAGGSWSGHRPSAGMVAELAQDKLREGMVALLRIMRLVMWFLPEQWSSSGSIPQPIVWSCSSHGLTGSVLLAARAPSASESSPELLELCVLSPGTG